MCGGAPSAPAPPPVLPEAPQPPPMTRATGVGEMRKHPLREFMSRHSNGEFRYLKSESPESLAREKSTILGG